MWWVGRGPEGRTQVPRGWLKLAGPGPRAGSDLGGAAVAPGMWLTAPHLPQVGPPALTLPRTPSWHWGWQGWWWAVGPGSLQPPLLFRGSGTLVAGCGLAPGVVPSPRPPPRGPLPELRHGVGLAPTEDPAGPTPQKAHRGLGVPGLVLRPGLLWSFSEMGVAGTVTSESAGRTVCPHAPTPQEGPGVRGLWCQQEHFLLPPQAVSTPSSPPRTEAAGAQGEDEYAEDSSDEEVGRRCGQGSRPSGGRVGVWPRPHSGSGRAIGVWDS